MKTSQILILTLFFLTAESLFGQNPFYDNIEFSQITCNFNGSCYGGKNLLVYGNGGIIRSTDMGTTWQRTAIGDSLNIIGMVNIADKFVGLCSKKYMIVSSDGGKNWQQHYLGDFTNYAIQTDGSNIYFLVAGELLVMNTALEKIKEYPIETDSLYNSFALSGKSVIISAGKAELLEINSENNQRRTISLAGFLGNATAKITTPITANGKDIYFSVASNLYRFNIESGIGATIFYVSYKKGSAIAAYGGNVYYLWRKSDLNDIDSVYFVRLGNDAAIKIKQPGNDRYIVGLWFHNLTFISADTLIAVGNSNLIYMSFNGGRKWEIKSFFAGAIDMFLFNDKEFRAIGNYAKISYTNNGGITWLPQKDYSPVYTENKYFYFPKNHSGCQFFKDKNNGFVYVTPLHTADTNTVITTNGGENTFLSVKYDFHFNNYVTYAIESENQYLFTSWGCHPDNIGCWTVIFRLNDTLGIEYKTVLPNWHFYYMTSFDNSLYAVGRDLADSALHYTVFVSNGKGKNWEKHFAFDIAADTLVEVEPFEVSHIGSSIYAEFFAIVENLSKQHILKIDIASKTTKNLLNIAAHGVWRVFNVGSNYFVGYYIYGNVLITDMLYTEDINRDSVVWQPLRTERFSMPFIGRFVSDTLFYFSATDTAKGDGAIYIARAKKSTSVIEEPITNSNQPLYISTPIPNPTRNSVKMRLYWDQTFDIENAEFSAFNVLGKAVSGAPKFQLTRQNLYSGELVWDAADIPAGVYFVRFRIGDKTTTTPVILE